MRTKLSILAAVLLALLVYFYCASFTLKETQSSAQPLGFDPHAELPPVKSTLAFTPTEARPVCFTQPRTPPSRLSILVFKQEKQMEIWSENNAVWQHLSTIPVLAASGHAGPKLKEGDCQVPEGVYKIAYLNPHSHYHLSMKLDYPNAFDRSKARLEKRTGLGDNIFIHGKDVSIGCLAIGDKPIEYLYALVKTVDRKNVKVIIAPSDLRRQMAVFSPTSQSAVSWLPALYRNLADELKPYRVGP